jgi:hypothetical protein
MTILCFCKGLDRTHRTGDHCPKKVEYEHANPEKTMLSAATKGWTPRAKIKGSVQHNYLRSGM